MASDSDTESTSGSYFSYPSEKNSESSYRGTSTSLDTSADSREDGSLPSITILTVMKRSESVAKPMSKPFTDLTVEEITKGGVKFYPEGIEHEISLNYKDIIQQIKDLNVEKAVVYVSTCMLVTLNADQKDIKGPKDLYCDICILSSKYPPIIVNVSNRSPRDDNNRRKYLTPLVRYINKELRGKVKDDIMCLALEIGLKDKISEEMITAKLEEVRGYSTTESLKMTKTKHQAVVRGFLNLICTCKTSKFIDYNPGNADLHQLTYEEFHVLTQALDRQIRNPEPIIETSGETLLLQVEIASRLARKDETLLELPREQFKHVDIESLRKEYPKLLLPKTDFAAKQHSRFVNYIVRTSDTYSEGEMYLDISTDISLQEANISEDEIRQDGDGVEPDTTTATMVGQNKPLASSLQKEMRTEYILAHASYIPPMYWWNLTPSGEPQLMPRPSCCERDNTTSIGTKYNETRMQKTEPLRDDKICSSPDSSTGSSTQKSNTGEQSQGDVFPSNRFLPFSSQMQENITKSAATVRPCIVHALSEPDMLNSVQSSQNVALCQDQSHRHQADDGNILTKEPFTIQHAANDIVRRQFSKSTAPRPHSYYNAVSPRTSSPTFANVNLPSRTVSTFPRTDPLEVKGIYGEYNPGQHHIDVVSSSVGTKYSETRMQKTEPLRGDKICSSPVQVQSDSSTGSSTQKSNTGEQSQGDVFPSNRFLPFSSQMQENITKSAATVRPCIVHALSEPDMLNSVQSSQNVALCQDQSHRHQADDRNILTKEPFTIQHAANDIVRRQFSKSTAPRPHSYYNAVSPRTSSPTFANINLGSRRATVREHHTDLVTKLYHCNRRKTSESPLFVHTDNRENGRKDVLSHVPDPPPRISSKHFFRSQINLQKGYKSSYV